MNMNAFELFTMIYFVLDAYYENDIEDPFINTVLSDMNPFVWADIGSADPAMYSEYLDFLNGRAITLENLTSYFFEWIAACPDEFKAWVEESMMDKGAENDDK